MAASSEFLSPPPPGSQNFEGDTPQTPYRTPLSAKDYKASSISPSWKFVLKSLQTGGLRALKKKAGRLSRPTSLFVDPQDLNPSSNAGLDEDDAPFVPSMNDEEDELEYREPLSPMLDASQSPSESEDEMDLDVERTTSSSRVVEQGKAKKPRAPRISRSKRAGLLFPVGRVDRMLRRGPHAEVLMRITGDAPVTLAAVLQYLVAEVLELSGDYCLKARRKIINPRHVHMSVRQDTELDILMQRATIPGSGYMIPDSQLFAIPTAPPKKKLPKSGEGSGASRSSRSGEESSSSGKKRRESPTESTHEPAKRKKT